MPNREASIAPVNQQEDERKLAGCDAQKKMFSGNYLFLTRLWLRRSSVTLPFRPLRPVLRCPVQALRVDPDLAFVHGLLVLIDNISADTDDILSLIVVD